MAGCYLANLEETIEGKNTSQSEVVLNYESGAQPNE